MAQVLVTIPDPWGAAIVAAECKNYKYSATLVNPETGALEANPQTALAFAIERRIQYMKDNLKAALVPDLAIADRAAKIAQIDAIEITIVPVV